jgi:hypothetical protein
MTDDAAAWGIPTLDLARQATGFPAPVVKWGTVKRGTPAETVHFYADDYKFSRLWHEPAKLIAAQPIVAVEVNFSTHADMPRAEVLWGIYRKRTLSRAWQQAGIAIAVDLNVEPAFRDLALLGVPPGWAAYATRIHRGVPFGVVEADHAQAVAHAGVARPLFVVFGGGQKVACACRRRGWLWIPEHRQVVEGVAHAYGTGSERGRGPVQGDSSVAR